MTDNKVKFNLFNLKIRRHICVFTNIYHMMRKIFLDMRTSIINKYIFIPEIRFALILMLI